MFLLHFPPPCVWENTNQEETHRGWEQVTIDVMEEDALAQNTVSFSLLFIYKDSELATVTSKFSDDDYNYEKSIFS